MSVVDHPKLQIVKTGYGPVGSVALVFLSTQLAAILGFLIGGLIYGRQDIPSGDIAAYFLIYLLIDLIALGMLATFMRVRDVKLKSLFGKLISWWHLCLVPAAFVAYFAVLAVATTIIQTLFRSANLDQEQSNPFKSATGDWHMVLAFVALVIITPIVEELIFRGFLYRSLKSKWPKWLAAVIASAVFGLAHGQLNVGIDTFILSLFLILLLEKSGSLVPSIMLHGLKNLIAFIVIFSVK